MLINGRGMLTGGVILLFYGFYSLVGEKERLSVKWLVKRGAPFFPVFLLLAGYFVYYFLNRGWFLHDPASPWATGWAPPEGPMGILKNMAAYFLRLAENGRIFIWAIGLLAVVKLLKTKRLKVEVQGVNGALGLMVILLFILFLYFALTTQLIIASRYYLGLFFIFTLLVFRLLVGFYKPRLVKQLALVSLLFLLSGNLWVYPDRIAKAWDGTLAHWSWTSVRGDCLDYMEAHHYDFSKVSGGFCLAGNQRYIDLKNRDLYISDGTDNQYFVYSNISNVGDAFGADLHDPEKWAIVKTFEKGFVEIAIYRNKLFEE
jgi:hypothetical protein